MWYNLDVEGFLEGAAAGTFGGWEPGDGDGGRTDLVDPAGLEDPVVLPEITWGAFTEFLQNGQGYE